MYRYSTKLRFAGVVAAFLTVGTAHAHEQGIGPGDGNAAATSTGIQTPLAGNETGGAHVSNLFEKVPLFFEPLEMEDDAGPVFLGRSRGYSVVLSAAEIALALQRPDPGLRSVLRMRLVDSVASPEITGLDRLPSESNYFVGNDPAKWRSHVPHYARTRMEGVYPGIDLVFYGNEKRLEYDFIVSPGTDYRTIALEIDGAESLAIEDGNLVARIGDREVVQQALLVYQEIDGERVPVDGRFVLRGGFEVGFEVAAYDPGEPLVIDPVLSYSTYFGGTSNDSGIAIAIDAAGNAYMAGNTTGVVPITYDLGGAPGSDDIYVVKFDPDGAFVHSTIFGGLGNDNPLAIAVDATGAAYVVGQTPSSDFPTTAGAFATSCASCPTVIDGFLTKISPDGASLAYSTYLGGTDSDGAKGVAVGSSGSAIVVGSTSSADFPTTPTPIQMARLGTTDAFVSKFSVDGSALIFSTYLGGTSVDEGFDVGLDASETIYVRGKTKSTDFPTTPGAFQTGLGGGGGVHYFVTKIDSLGTGLQASTLIGHISTGGRGGGFAVDAAGYAYVTGSAQGSQYPLLNPVDIEADGVLDAVLTKLTPDLSSLVYSTYLGGSGFDSGNDVAVDAAGNAYVSGWTVSTDFPTTPDAIQDTLISLPPGSCAPPQPNDPLAPCSTHFVTKFDTAGAIVFSTYLGGSNSDSGVGHDNFRHNLAVDALGNVFLTGTTSSADFPTTANAYNPTSNGSGDAFVLRIGAVVRQDVAVFHIDSVDGDDVTGDGSFAAPWQTLSMVNAIALIPGDQVLLKRGSVFREWLIIDENSNGTAADPIVVDAYDDVGAEGAMPIISAGFLIPQYAGWLGPGANGEFNLTVGSIVADEFVTSAAVLVRAEPTGIDTYRLLARGLKGSLDEDTYSAESEAGIRVLYYKPPVGTNPDDFEFELSRRQAAIIVLGDYVRVGHVQAILGNIGNQNLNSPLGIPIRAAVVYSEGAGVEFHDCHAAFGRGFGIAVTGPDSLIDGCIAEHNHSTGLYILGAAATGSTIRNSVARYNGNLETGDLDRGGIGVQSSGTVISDNIVHDNGNITDTTGPRVAGDDAIGVFDSNDVLVEGNFIYNSARGAIGASNTPNTFGHRIIGNVIYNWNLVGPACEAVASCESVRRSAIDLFGWGDTVNSGRHTVWNNTIHSDQVENELFGIQLRTIWQSAHTLQGTSVLNNLISMPDNAHPGTFGMRMTGGNGYFDVAIDFNDVYLPSKPDQQAYAWLDGAGQISFATALNFSLNEVICRADATLARCLAENLTRLYEFSGLNVDPELNLALANPADPARYDLTSASPLINAGTDVGLTKDFLGRLIPFSLAPDIGAFESPFDCQDTDLDGVCDSQDLCAAGPIIVEGLQAPLGLLSLEGDDPVAPNKAFKQNRTLPLKLTLSCGGVVLGDTDIPAPTISEVALAGLPLDLPTIDLDAGDANDGGVSFRFEDDIWVYNLSTRGLDPGSYVISVATPEDVRYTGAFVLR